MNLAGKVFQITNLDLYQQKAISDGKIKFMEREHGHATSIMRSIKTALDPNNILNPGKIFS